MNTPVLTLGSAVEVVIGVLVVIFWIIGALSKLKGEPNKSAPAPRRSTPATGTGGASVAQVSAQDRLRTLSEQRRAQLQERVRQGSGGQSAPPPPQRAPRLDSVARAAPADRPSASESAYRGEIAEQLQQMQRANEQRQASAPARHVPPPPPPPLTARRPIPAPPPIPAARTKRSRPQPSQPGGADAVSAQSTAELSHAGGGPGRKKGRVRLGELSVDRLREAFVLKELLDKPVSLRDESGGPGAW